MTLDDAMTRLADLTNPVTYAFNEKNGAQGQQFAVKHGDIRGLAKQFKTDPGLGMQLWDTGNIDARLLAILLLTSNSFRWVSDWFNACVLKQHPEKETLRQKWTRDTTWRLRPGQRQQSCRQRFDSRAGTAPA